MAINTGKIQAKGTDNLKVVDNGGSIEMLELEKTDSAVNHVKVKNAATGGGPIISSTGDDTNVDLNVTTKGTGAVSVESSYLGLSNGATSAGELRFYEDSDDGAHYFALKAGAMAASLTYTLPTADGSNGQQLTTNGSGVLSWTNQGASGGGSVSADDINAGDAAVTITTSTGNITIDAAANDSDIILKGTDGGADTTFLTIDGSEAGTATFNNDVKLGSDSAILSLGAGDDATLTHDGTTGLTIAATPISIDSTGELHLNSTTGDIKLQDGGTDQIAFDLDGTAGAVIMKTMVDSDDLVIQQYDGNEVIRFTDDGHVEVKDNLSLKSDAAVLTFGGDQEVTLTHVHNVGLTLKHTATADDKPIVFTLATGETDMQANDVIGKIAFQAPDEGTGTDAILVAAGIQAVSEGDFSTTNNATRLEFMTAASEAATAKMTLSSAGVLDVDGGITVDDITIDGTEIDLSSGDLTVDVAGDIILDADGDHISLKFGGATGQLDITNGSSGDIIFQQKTDGKNIVFRDHDGSTNGLTIHDAGAGITVPGTVLTTELAFTDGDSAMTIADGGGVTVAESLAFGDSIQAKFGTDADVKISYDNGQGSLDFVMESTATGGVVISSAESDAAKLTIKNSENNTAGPVILLRNDRAHGNISDGNESCGSISFQADDTGGAVTSYGTILVSATDSSANSEEGQMKLQVAANNGNIADGIVVTGNSGAAQVDVTVGLGASSTVTVPGGIDLAGNIDVDGTANLDAVDIDGNVNITGGSSLGGNSLDIVHTDVDTHGLKVAATDLTSGNPIFIDMNNDVSANGTHTKGVVYDLDLTANVGSGHSITSTGIFLDMDVDNSGRNAASTVNLVGLHIDMDFSNTDGISKAKGIIIDMTNTGANGTAAHGTDDTTAIEIVEGNVTLADSQSVVFGSAGDLVIQHNATNSILNNATGHLVIENTPNDKDVKVKLGNTDGSTAFKILDSGDNVEITLADNGNITMGSTLANGSGDFTIDAADDLVLDAHGGDLKFAVQASTKMKIKHNNSGDITFENSTNDKDIIFKANDSDGGGSLEAFRIVGAENAALMIEATPIIKAGIETIKFGNDANANQIRLTKTRNSNAMGHTVVALADSLGEITFEGSDGDEMLVAAKISAQVDGSPGNNDMPGRLDFMVTKDGANSPSTRMIIDSGGTVIEGTANNAGGAYHRLKNQKVNINDNTATTIAQVTMINDSGGSPVSHCVGLRILGLVSSNDATHVSTFECFVTIGKQNDAASVVTVGSVTQTNVGDNGGSGTAGAGAITVETVTSGGTDADQTININVKCDHSDNGQRDFSVMIELLNQNASGCFIVPA